MAEFDRRRAAPVAGTLLVIPFLGWTVVAPLVSYYTQDRIRKRTGGRGPPAELQRTRRDALMLVFSVGVLYHQSELNRVVPQRARAGPILVIGATGIGRPSPAPPQVSRADLQQVPRTGQEESACRRLGDRLAATSRRGGVSVASTSSSAACPRTPGASVGEGPTVIVAAYHHC